MAKTYSEKYEKVNKYYKKGLWDIKKVKDAVGRWITKNEYKEITGEDFE